MSTKTTPPKPVKLNPDLLEEWPSAPEDGEDYEDKLLKLGTQDLISSRKARFFESQVSIDSTLEWFAVDAAFRNSRIEIGRVGSLDFTGTTLNIVEFSNLKAGYANFVNAKLFDVLFSDCSFETLDLCGCKAKNVRFERCRVDELDIRTIEIENLDLRGLDFAGVRGLPSLKGATISEYQLGQISGELAKSAGIRVE